MTVYYAHPISTYGTPVEQRDLALLKALGLTVVNPNTPEHDSGYRRNGMPYFGILVQECDCLAFRAFTDGSIPAGVAQEIQMLGAKPVFELPSAVVRRTLTVEATRATLCDGGTR
jgi:hypothetical protein